MGSDCVRVRKYEPNCPGTVEAVITRCSSFSERMPNTSTHIWKLHAD